MSLYTELLRTALAERTDDTVPVAELVANLTTRRANRGFRSDSMGSLADALTYDVALVRLCARLGVGCDIVGEPWAESRLRAEERLFECLPALAEIETTDPQKIGAERYG